MATKKKSTKRSMKSKKTSVRKLKPAKNRAKKTTKAKKSSSILARGKAKMKRPRPEERKTANQKRKKRPGKPDAVLSQFVRRPDSGGQSGDLQGLSRLESADSESVDELIEEGNAFEAGVVSGVEDAEKRSAREVRTREVPEDDVPGEYLDEE